MISPYNSLMSMSPYSRKQSSANPELYVSENALATTVEADATTGLTSANLDGTGANVFESQTVDTNGSAAAIHIDMNDTPTNSARFYQDLSGILVSGQTYIISLDMKHTGVGDNVRAAMASNTYLTGYTTIKVVTNSDTTWTTTEIEFTYNGSNHYFVVSEHSGTNDGAAYIDNLSIKLKV